MNFIKFRLSLAFIVLSLAWCFQIFAQDIPDPMSPPRLVNDFAGIFSDGQKQELEAMLRAYNDSTSTQIYVVTVNDLQGYAASDFAPRLGEKWEIGQKGKNNGAVILIKPKTSSSRGDLFIATGYGLEEKLTDARCGRIMDEYMIPYFKQNDYYSGTKAAIEAMIGYLSGQFKADKSDNGNGGDLGQMIFLVIFIIVFVIIFTRNGRNNGNNSGNGGGGGMFFPPIFPGRRGSDSDDEGGFGGFGGGSFGGGGGGSFGGGGAGRSW